MNKLNKAVIKSKHLGTKPLLSVVLPIIFMAPIQNEAFNLMAL